MMGEQDRLYPAKWKSWWARESVYEDRDPDAWMGLPLIKENTDA